LQTIFLKRRIKTHAYLECVDRVLDEFDQIRVEVTRTRQEFLKELDCKRGLAALYELLKLARVPVHLEERLVGDGYLMLDALVDLVESGLGVEVSLVLFVEHDHPGAAVGPLLVEVDPGGEDAPVEVDVVGAEETTGEADDVDQATQVARVYVEEVVGLDQLVGQIVGRHL